MNVQPITGKVQGHIVSEQLEIRMENISKAVQLVRVNTLTSSMLPAADPYSCWRCVPFLWITVFIVLGRANFKNNEAEVLVGERGVGEL